MEYYTTVQEDSINMWSGELLWSIAMKNTSRFNIADGILIDTQFEKTNYPVLAGGYWACDGGIATITGSGIWGVSSSHSFEMGYGVSQGTNSSVSVTPSHMGLSIYANSIVYYTGILTDFHNW